MPRITAETLAEHVARQEEAVLAAALRLFLARGYAQVTLADIAAEVGLKRNSLYRYFPDKGHIALRWLQRELPRQIARSRELLSGPGEPAERIRAWALHQLDYAGRPEHRLLAGLPDVARDLDEQARAELADSHRQLMEPLADTLAEAGLNGAERAAAVHLVGSLVLAAAAYEDGGRADPVARRQLEAALRALVQRSPASSS
jgi:AcrR family transcriptional regulator